MKLILIIVLDLYILFVVLNSLVGTERKPCPLTSHKVKKLALCVNTRATVYKLEHRANFVQWPLLNYVAREQKVCRGATQLEQFSNYFPRPFLPECLLNDYIVYLRTYEK